MTQYSPAKSTYTSKLEDARAVYLTDAIGDGIADDTAAVQAAINKAYSDRLAGIVFIPEGRYRLTRTVYVPPAVRVIGWGNSRPAFVLADNTPGFNSGIAVMVMFVGTLPSGGHFTVGLSFPPPGSVPPTNSIPDANPSTFYSAMSNINFEIGEGNAGAVCVRFHGAQHDYLTHMDFYIGSGLAGVHQVANEAEDLRFFGGRYGILAEKPSPAWQFTLIDSLFDGQRDAAIREHEVSLTLENVTFRNVPIGIDIDPEYADWLWAKNTRFENISHAAVVISAENNVYNQISFEDAIASNVPVFARFRESGKSVGSDGIYHVKEFNHGLIVSEPGAMGEIGTRFKMESLGALPAPRAATIRAFPPTLQWVNLKTLGAAGDGFTDDTDAIRFAIQNYSIIYVPSGHYQISDTLTLKPDTVLIGLHPSITQFVLPDSTPEFQGIGSPKPIIETPVNGNNIVAGIGFSTGGINPRALGVLWQAGENSLMNDVYFSGGHGTVNPDGTIWYPYNESVTGDADPQKRWGAQYPSLWITNGGGGIFTNIWTPSAYAQAGILVSDTKTPGRVFQLSSEHHVRNEIVVRNVENWDFYAMQTEEEGAESREAIGFEISHCRNITIANYHGYRVTRSRGPMDTAIRVFNSEDIRFRNIHVNAESGFAANDHNGTGFFLRASKFSFENAIRDASHHIDVREREFAVLNYSTSQISTAHQSSTKTANLLESGFYSISGGVVDANGKLYFVDKHQQRIYGWDDKDGLTIERDNPFDPVNLAIDDAGNIIVLSSLGAECTVYSFNPGSSKTETQIIPATELTPSPNTKIAIPANYWNNGEFRDQLNVETFQYTTLTELFVNDLAKPKAQCYVSLDGSLILPATRVFQQGPENHIGWRFSDNLNTYGFITAKPGERTYLINSSEARTYTGLVNANGSITDLKLFAERGGESFAVDAEGNVYLANGQIFIYDPTGKCIGQIDVPERPLQLVFGGKDKKTLLILTHHGLYGVPLVGHP